MMTTPLRPIQIATYMYACVAVDRLSRNVRRQRSGGMQEPIIKTSPAHDEHTFTILKNTDSGSASARARGGDPPSTIVMCVCLQGLRVGVAVSWAWSDVAFAKLQLARSGGMAIKPRRACNVCGMHITTAHAPCLD